MSFGGGFRLAAGALFAAVVLAYGALAWREAERRTLSAAEAEARALLGAVACGVESSIAASGAVESLLGERLLADARLTGVALAASPGLEEQVLATDVERRSLAGAALLDPDLGLVASSDSRRADAAPDAENPFEGGRLARLDLGSLVERLRAAGLATHDEIVLGFNEGPFAVRTEFAVAVRVPELPGFVVLRADASQLEALRADAGVAHVLRESARAPGIASVVVQDADGTCLAADDPELVGAVLPAPRESPAWTVGRDGRRTLDLAAPVGWTGGRSGHVRVALDAAPLDAVISRSRRDVVLVTATALALSCGALLALAALERRRRAAEASLTAELARSEQFASLGRLAAGMAHEVRGPLNALSLETQLLAREADAGPGRIAEVVTSIRAAVARLETAVRDFLALGRLSAGMTPRPADLAEVVRTALAWEGGTLREDPPAAPVVVACDVNLLGRALANLIRNARQNAPPESVRVSWRRDSAEAVLDVDDGGGGVPPERRAEIFAPFKSSRADGVGLGLTLAHDAVVRHGGRIEVLDAPGGGARFRMRLPAEAGS